MILFCLLTFNFLFYIFSAFILFKISIWE